MGALLQFLKTYLHVLLFAIALLFGGTMLLRYHLKYQSVYLNTSRWMSGNLTNITQKVYQYRHLQAANNHLINENIRLRKQMRENFHMIPTDTFRINDTLFKQRYTYIPASVIGNTLDKADNFITINRGRSSGIAKGMGVFSPDGVVGVVQDVSENFSLIMSLLNSKAVVSPKIQEINLSQGKVTWLNRNPDYAYLTNINRYEKIENGFTVVTSPYSQNFPENIPIGKVVELSEVDGSFYKIKIKLSTSFSQLREVYVVKDLLKDELEKLYQEVEE